MVSTRISHIKTVKSRLSVRSMANIIMKYEIDPNFHPSLPEADDAITNAPKDSVGIYSVFFKSGLRLPTFDFLEIILEYYGMHIYQITLNRFRKVLCFSLPCIS